MPVAENVNLSQNGPPDFEEIYERHFDPIFKFILHRVANVAEAEDLTSLTFFSALKNFWKFRWTKAPVSAWLYRIAINEVNGYFRARGKTNDSPYDEEAPIADPRSAVERELHEAEQELHRNQLYMDLHACLVELKPDEQTLIVLRFYEHKSFAEIAQIMRKREGSLVMRAHRALAKLKKELEKRGIDHERLRDCFEEPAQTEYSGERLQTGFAS